MAAATSSPSLPNAVRFAATTDDILQSGTSKVDDTASSMRMEPLDLADPSNRMSASPEVIARLEQKRMEHERQRAIQQTLFQQQMRKLEARQAAEEAELLGISSGSSAASTSPDGRTLGKDTKRVKSSASAPATPPHSPRNLSSDDEDNEQQPKAAYSRMTQSIADLPRADLSKSVTLQGSSPEDTHPSKYYRSKSGTDLTMFSDGIYGSAFPAFSPVQPGGRTAPVSPTTATNGTGTNGHIGSGSRSRFISSQTKSMPASRQHSDEEDDEQNERSGGLTESLSKLDLDERKSRSTSLKPTTNGVLSNDAGLLTSFLFEDEQDDMQNAALGGRYLAMNADDDKFPVLIRRDDYPGILSASSAALDLAPLSQTPPRSNGFRQQQAQASSRGSEWPVYSQSSDNLKGSNNLQTGFSVPQKSHSLGPQPSSPATARTLPPPGSGRTSPLTELSPAKRVPGINPSLTDESRSSKRASVIGLGSSTNVNGLASAVHAQPFQVNNYGYDQSAAQQNGFYPYGDYGMQQPGYDRSAAGRQSFASINGIQYGRREEANRFAGLRLEDFQGDMANLCKDQHGCRFLQRKLEEGNPLYRDMIFTEVYPYFADLMIDSFGNYLAQRLLEFSSDEQKDVILASIHDELVNISLNIHGTRAIQRLIDHLTTPRHIATLVSALSPHVVALIKDLNGNHVIQKCLNTLKPDDNQFIFNAVSANCVEVATHRHGCCVLQRCIDHASEAQRIQVVTEITYQCLTLVQDPFSNYVVQYCLEFDPRFVDAMIRQFQGHICALSCHKFSSNVIEKCIRVSGAEGRRMIVTELLDTQRLERLVKDNFGNYVVQTACDFADPVQREQLIALIRPMLPAIRNTPYGKRIAARVQKASSGSRYASYPNSGGFAAYGPPPSMMPPYGQPPPTAGPQHLLEAFQQTLPAQQPFANTDSQRSFMNPHMQYNVGPADYGVPQQSTFSPFQ